MGDKRLYFDEYEKKQYYLDENGDPVYLESELSDKKPDSSVKVAVIGGVFAVIVAIISIIPLFPRETPSGETEYESLICIAFNCGNQTNNIEIAVAATLTAVAPTPIPTEMIPTITLSATPTNTQTATPQIPATPTQIMLTSTPELEVSAICRETSSQDAIPSGNEASITVNPGEFHIWTSGDFCVDYQDSRILCELGTDNKGFVSIFLPVNDAPTTYRLTNLVPRNSWHGVYRDCNEQEQTSWVSHRANGMRRLPNCPNTGGCEIIEIISLQGAAMDRYSYLP